MLMKTLLEAEKNSLSIPGIKNKLGLLSDALAYPIGKYLYSYIESNESNDLSLETR